MPMDGSKFMEIEEKWPHFKEESQNLRLSLEANSANPFGEMRFFHLVWPTFVIYNNLPLWM